MRNALLVLLIFFFITPVLHSQMTEITCTNGNEFCVGLSAESYAQVHIMTPPPIPLPSNSTFTYIWTVKHQNGTTWIWHTNLDCKAIPIPWEGEYTVRVKILYVKKYQNYPFAAFWSNTIKIYGKQCLVEGTEARTGN